MFTDNVSLVTFLMDYRVAHQQWMADNESTKMRQ